MVVTCSASRSSIEIRWRRVIGPSSGRGRVVGTSSVGDDGVLAVDLGEQHPDACSP
jgi:hypothetical protein